MRKLGYKKLKMTKRIIDKNIKCKNEKTHKRKYKNVKMQYGKNRKMENRGIIKIKTRK